jgi:transposase-like protein
MGQEKKRNKRVEVVEEYLKGGISLREMGKKHGINHRTIHRWVKACESGGGVDAGRMRVEAMRAMPNDVRRLQRELYEARLHAKLLETMIDIAENEMGVVIRKKHGAKQ